MGCCSSSDVSQLEKDNVELENEVGSTVCLSRTEEREKNAVMAGRLNSTNGWIVFFLVIATLGFYLCLRKKYYGGIMVTSRRVIHVSMEKSGAGVVIEFEQTAYMIRHFAHETHTYRQPEFSCMDYCCCVPCMMCCMCLKNDPTARLDLYFVEYPDNGISISAGSAWGLCASCVRCCCMPCFKLCYSCCFSGSAGFSRNRASIQMAVSFETGYRKMANVLAAILYYHPAKDIQVAANGDGWDPHSSESHPRLASVELDETIDFEDYSKHYKVPVQKPEEGKSTVIGLVMGEKLIDGYAGPLKFCNWFMVLCCIGTLCIHTMCSYCMWRKCARVRREFYVLTDRRLIRFSILTSGASTQVRFWQPDVGDAELTHFGLEISSWVLTSVHTYRYKQEWPCCACCGKCCCCKKASYEVSLHTFFGSISLEGEGAEVGSSGTGPLEEFLRSLMRQNSESPLSHSIADNSLSFDGCGKKPITEPSDEADVYLNEQVGERYVAHVKGWLRTNMLSKLCCCPLRILTCCCCPRNRNSHLYVTSHRMITAAQVLVPCCNIPLENYVEYYSLNRVLRVRFKRRKECNCCGCCACCLVNAIGISTDRDFEDSAEGEEIYEVGSDGEVEGVPGSDNHEKIRNFVTIFSLLNTQDGWMLQKAVLDNNMSDRIAEPSLFISGNV